MSKWFLRTMSLVLLLTAVGIGWVIFSDTSFLLSVVNTVALIIALMSAFAAGIVLRISTEKQKKTGEVKPVNMRRRKLVRWIEVISSLVIASEVVAITIWGWQLGLAYWAFGWFIIVFLAGWFVQLFIIRR